MKELIALKKNLRELRKQNNYTQKYVAESLNIQEHTYRAYELGKNLMPLTALIKLADLYDISIDALLNRADI